MPFFTNFAAVQKIPPTHNMLPEYININDYDYPLPDERIARFPLEQSFLYTCDPAGIINLIPNQQNPDSGGVKCV